MREVLILKGPSMTYAVEHSIKKHLAIRGLVWTCDVRQVLEAQMDQALLILPDKQHCCATESIDADACPELT